MRVFWETGVAEMADGRPLEGRVLTFEVGRFSLSIWLTRVVR